MPVAATVIGASSVGSRIHIYIHTYIHTGAMSRGTDTNVAVLGSRVLTGFIWPHEGCTFRVRGGIQSDGC